MEFEEKRQNFVSKQVHLILKLDYEFRAGIKNLLKDYKKDEIFRESIRDDLTSKKKPQIDQLLEKIKAFADEMNKKVELFNLLDELAKGISAIRPLKFKMDSIVYINNYP